MPDNRTGEHAGRICRFFSFTLLFELRQQFEQSSTGREYQEIDERIQRRIEGQRLSFVATAPRSNDGRINCSSKELDEFRTERELLKNWYDNKTADEVLDYRIERTAVSSVGLPGLDVHTLRDLS